MAKVSKVRRKSASRRHNVAPYFLPPSPKKVMDGRCEKKCYRLSGKKDWEDCTCSVCMEFPHNAVLLLCSSHNKGCRPYMCATSYRYSNCLDQYKKAYSKKISENALLGSMEDSIEKKEVAELLCPLCRGQVKGWTVVEPARQYLNAKRRTCFQENCSFIGNYKQLRKHVRADHPLARPRQVDPRLEAKWARLEHERERSDVISTVISSSTPGSIVIGDYVIERGFDDDFDDLDEFDDLGGAIWGDVFLPLESFGTGRNVGVNLPQSIQNALNALGGEDDRLFRSNRRRPLYARPRRRRRHRVGSGGNR